MRSIGTFIAGLLVVGALPALAQEDVDPMIVEAQAALRAEVELLVALDAFPSIDMFDGIVTDAFAGGERRELLPLIADVDQRGVAALNALTDAGFIASPAMQRTLGFLSRLDVALLVAGNRIRIAPMEYVAAGQNLAELTGQPGPAVAQPAPLPATPSRPLVIGMAVILAAALTAMIVRRRHPSTTASPSAPADPQFDRLLDAGRRMTAALDIGQVAGIARRQAMDLVESRHAAFVAVHPHLTLLDASGEFLDERRLGEGVLARVAETGQAVFVVTHDEPALTALPASVLAMPVIGSGRVSGILTVIRSADEPFTTAEQKLIGQFAPMVGSAMAAAEQHGDVTEQTMVDPLTGLSNRRRLDRDLSSATSSMGDGEVLGIAMIDIDHFKHLNDTHGHSAGDTALRIVADAIRKSLRDDDSAYRYGGEEFSLVLRGVAGREAVDVVERVRTAVEAAAVPGEETQPGGRLTVSVGLAVVGEECDALAMADDALYRAKQAGRNCVVVVDEAPEVVSEAVA